MKFWMFAKKVGEKVGSASGYV